MGNAIILHGTCDKVEYFSDKFPSLSNAHWFPWLQKQLLIKGIFTQTPEIPEAFNPQYDLWRKEFERYSLDRETILVGHSCGGGFLIRWLTENKVDVNKLILVSPWLDPERLKTTDFFDFKIDPSFLDRINEIHLLVSTDDDSDIHQSVSIITSALPDIIVHKFTGMGHFTFGQMQTEKFPELLQIIIGN
ncbi:MAG: alpha/beta hydrolase [bacterium]